MALSEWERADFSAIENIVGDFGRLHGSIPAVLSGAAAGEVWVDNIESPAIALIHGPEGVYLVGACPSEAVAADVREHLDDWVYLYVSPDWGVDPADAWPNPYLVAHPRLTYTLPAVGQIAAPAGPYRLEVDEDGFGCRAYFNGASIAQCLPDMVVGTRAEIGVFVQPEHRRIGLGKWLAAECANRLHAAGIDHVGWHCHASNSGSIAIARSLGAGDPATSSAYSASLPAENRGDLEQAQCVAFAHHFTRGAQEISWLDFHAACAWSLAGEDGRALDAVDRLVAARWPGSPNWLAGHWALANLRYQQRMADAIEALKKQKVSAS